MWNGMKTRFHTPWSQDRDLLHPYLPPPWACGLTHSWHQINGCWSYYTNYTGVHTAWFWVPDITQRATFTMSGALLGMNLEFQMKQNLQREEWWHVHHNPGKGLGEASAGGSCHCCHGKLMADISVTLPGDTGHPAIQKFAAASGATPIAGCFTPVTFTTQNQAAFWELSFTAGYWLLIPRLTASLSQRHLIVTCPLLPHVMKTLSCAMRTLLSHAPARELPQRVWRGRYRSRKFCRCPAPSACPWEAVHNLLLPQRSWTDGRGRADCVTRRNFRVNGLLQFLDSLLCVLSHSVMSNSLWPHGLQPARLLCPWGFSRQEY